MNETCKAIENLKELVKMFLGAQIELNDLNREDIEKLEEKITELDHNTTIVLNDLTKRVMILEEKVKHYL